MDWESKQPQDSIFPHLFAEHSLLSMILFLPSCVLLTRARYIPYIKDEDPDKYGFLNELFNTYDDNLLEDDENIGSCRTKQANERANGAACIVVFGFA